jgi:ATP-binding cassette subfamily F protein uup
MIAGQMDPDGGSLVRTRGLRVGYLPQIPEFRDGVTVGEVVREAAAMEHAVDASALSADEAMSRLGLKTKENSMESLEVESLSGGWKKKVALAAELAKGPDLLLLDEPTNHLDLESILWLEDWIRNASIAVMTISHDREFLRRVGERVIEVDRRNPNGILSVDGGYDEFLVTKQSYLESMASRMTSMENTLRREVEWLRRGAKARTTKQKARIDRAYALESETAGLREKSRETKIKLEFQAAEGAPKKLIEAKEISKAYGERKLFSGLDLLITSRTRLGLIGRNGIGKSTLIRILTGEEEPDTGEVKRSERLQVAFFEQNRDALDPSISVLRTVCPYGETVEFQGRKIHVRSYLDRFHFDTRQGELEVGKLSGGEQSRLLLAMLMLEPANLLVLDEPTNDLDLQTLGILEECLDEFPGAVLLVSHDRAFMNAVCDSILAFPELIRYADMEQWEKRRKEMMNEERARDKAAAKAGTGGGASGGKRKKLGYMEQRELDGMEATILNKETKIATLQDEANSEEFARNAIKLAEVMRSIAALQSEVEDLYIRWAELEAKQN